MNYSDFTGWLSGMVPRRRRGTFDWVLPASIGVGIGLAAGIGVGMLLAPTPGDEMRRKLKSSAMRMKDKALYGAGRISGQLQSKANEVERSFVEQSNQSYGR